MNQPINPANSPNSFITMNDLELLGACETGKEEFFKLFENDMEINESNLKIALANNLSIDWLIDELNLDDKLRHELSFYNELRVRQSEQTYKKWLEAENKFHSREVMEEFYTKRIDEVCEFFLIPPFTQLLADFLNAHYDDAINRYVEAQQESHYEDYDPIN